MDRLRGKYLGTARNPLWPRRRVSTGAVPPFHSSRLWPLLKSDSSSSSAAAAFSATWPCLPPSLVPPPAAARSKRDGAMEMSIKKHVRRFREVIQAPEKVVLNPCIESLCGDRCGWDSLEGNKDFMMIGVLSS